MRTMFIIRSEKHEDIHKLKEVNDLAFGRDNESKLIEAIRQSETFIPELSLVAENEAGEIIGHVLLSKIIIETQDQSIPSLALAPMAVKPEYQNQKIGSQLVKEALNRSKSLGFESVVVLGHKEFYPRFGFIPASKKSIRPPFDVPDEVFMVLELKENALQGIQGTVKYPDAFQKV